MVRPWWWWNAKLLKTERWLTNKIRNKPWIHNSVVIQQPAIVIVSTNTNSNTISDICEHPRQIQRYSCNGKQHILVCCSNNWIRLYGSVPILQLHFWITYLSSSVLSIFLFSTSPEKVIHRSGNPAVFSLSPASSLSLYHLAKDRCQGHQQETEKARWTTRVSQLFIFMVFSSSASCHW